MLKPIIATSLLFISQFVSASEPLPTVEFIQDGEVIESRLMSAAEYQAYTDIQQMDVQIEALTAPIEAVEERIEAKADLIEEQVEAHVEKVVEQTLSQFGSNRQSANVDVSMAPTIDMSEINDLLAQIQPQLEQIEAMAEQISGKANDFKALILSDYQEDEIDRVRIIGEDDSDNIHFH